MIEKSYRLEDIGEHWLVVLRYNEAWHQDIYYSKESYREKEDVIRALHRSYVIEWNTPLIGDDDWEAIQKRQADIAKMERGHKINTSFKYIG